MTLLDVEQDTSTGKACPGHDEIWPCVVIYFGRTETYSTWVMLSLLMCGPVAFVLYKVWSFFNHLFEMLKNYWTNRRFTSTTNLRKVSLGDVGPILFEISPAKMEHYRPRNDPFRQKEEPEIPARGFIVSQMINACDSSDVRNRGKKGKKKVVAPPEKKKHSRSSDVDPPEKKRHSKSSDAQSKTRPSLVNTYRSTDDHVKSRSNSAGAASKRTSTKM